MINVKSVITGMVFGSLAAGSAVLLMTPKSGEAWRKELQTRSRDVGTALGQIKNDGIALKNDIVTASRQSIPAVKEGARGIKLSVDEWRKATEPDIKDLQKQIQELNDQMDKLEENTKKEPSSK
ncbi:MAG TPA: hypothetical protein VFK33_05535 [Bacillales bacterium]|nr:hypothetical protein [Bacillales bacterium]